MEALLGRLDLENPRLAAETQRPERVSFPRVSLSPLSLVHPLMVSPFMLPSTTWHMMHTKAYTLGVTHWVTQFME